MQQTIEDAMLPLDEFAREMMRDLRLLEVGGALLDRQFQKLLFQGRWLSNSEHKALLI